MTRPFEFLLRRGGQSHEAKPVAPEDARALLEAGMAAPSAAPTKPWHFVTIANPYRLQALAAAHTHGTMLAESALAIAVCVDPEVAGGNWNQEVSGVTQNILLAAVSLGLGSIWIGSHPNPERKAAIRKILGIPESVDILSLVAIGYPSTGKPNRAEFPEDRVHHEEW
jgi:nitroreductase